MRHARQLLFIGAERAGKSNLAERMADTLVRSGRMAFVYNMGKRSDFPDYKHIHIESWNEYLYHLGDLTAKERRRLELMAGVKNFTLPDDPESRTPIERLPFFDCKKFKSWRVGGSDDHFFRAYAKYILHGCLIIDDARVITRNGISNGLIELINKKNHTGYKASPELLGLRPEGSDVMMLFHGISKVNPELYDTATDVILMQQRSRPIKTMSDYVNEVYQDCYELVNSLPKYSYIHINITEEKVISYKSTGDYKYSISNVFK